MNIPNRESVNQLICDLLCVIGSAQFYENIDKYIKVIVPGAVNNNQDKDPWTRLDSTAASIMLENTKYSGSVRLWNSYSLSFSDSIFGELITDIFGTSIFSSVLMIGDAILSTVFSLLTF